MKKLTLSSDTSIPEDGLIETASIKGIRLTADTVKLCDAEAVPKLVVKVNVVGEALIVGEVLLQILAAVALFLGAVVATVKSEPLLSLSWQPPLFLKAAVVLLRIAVGLLPSEQFAVGPYPTKSTTAPVGHVVPPTIVVLLAKTIFPAVPLILIVPAPPEMNTVGFASGVGNATPLAPQNAN